VFVSNVYRKQALVERRPGKSVWRTIYVKRWLAYGQSEFLVGESLHNVTGFIPVLLCAGLPPASHFMIESVAFVCASKKEIGRSI
jgi:hypothetical protein